MPLLRAVAWLACVALVLLDPRIRGSLGLATHQVALLYPAGALMAIAVLFGVLAREPDATGRRRFRLRPQSEGDSDVLTSAMHLLPLFLLVVVGVRALDSSGLVVDLRNPTARPPASGQHSPRRAPAATESAATKSSATAGSASGPTSAVPASSATTSVVVTQRSSGTSPATASLHAAASPSGVSPGIDLGDELLGTSGFGIGLPPTPPVLNAEPVPMDANALQKTTDRPEVVRVILSGFALPRDDRMLRDQAELLPAGTKLLLFRYVVTCCAADALPAFVLLREGSMPFPPIPKVDEWIEVIGRRVPSDDPTALPQLEVESLRIVPKPRDPYLMGKLPGSD